MVHASHVGQHLGNGAHHSFKTPEGDEQPRMRRRILIVEDNETAGRQLQKFLQADAELEIDVTNNGENAIRALSDDNYSIVVTDLRMPRMDGMELIKQVQRRGLPVTVIVTTGHGSIDEALQAIRLGAYDFLTKPIDVENLRLVVQRALRERSLQDEVASLRAQLQT